MNIKNLFRINKKGRKKKEETSKSTEDIQDRGDLREITKEILDKSADELAHEEKHMEGLYAKKREEWKVKELLKKARILERKNKYRDAIKAYLRFLEKNLLIIGSRKRYGLNDYYKLVDYYVKIAELYMKIHHIKAEDRIKDMRKAAEYYEKAAKMYMGKGEYNSAHKNYQKAADIYEEIKMYEKSADNYLGIAEMYRLKGDKLLTSDFYDKAAKYYSMAENHDRTIEMISKSAELRINIGDRKGASDDYMRIADMYRSTGKHQEAIKFYAKSVEILYGMEKFIELREIYDRIAQDYENINEYNDAIYYYLGSAFLNEGRDDLAASNAFEGAAHCYEKLKDYKNAIQYYTKAADLNIKLKRYLNAAYILKSIGKCYESMGNEEMAADYYFKYAEYGITDKKGLACMEGFKMAVNIYLRMIDLEMNKKRYKKAIELYKKLARSYSGLKDFKKAGDSFYRAAEMEREMGYDIKTYVYTYRESIKEYTKACDFWCIARSYKKMKEYDNAVKFYNKYADEQSKKDNPFYSGEGYRKSGDCFREMNNRKEMLKSYNKAIKYYSLHLEKIRKRKIIEDQRASVGNTLKYIAESYRNMNQLGNARDYYRKALKYFEEKNMLKEVTFIRAFLNKIEAKIVIRSGDYSRADKLLRISIEAFDELLKDKELSMDYRNFLQKNRDDTKKILDSIAQKPEVSLLLDRHSYTFKGIPLVLNMELKNKSANPIYNISFLPHLPDELKIHMEPNPIEKIDSGEVIKTSMEVISDTPGEYRLKPIEVIYEDEDGEKYVKASNLISISVVDRPSMDYKDYNVAIATYLEYAEAQLNNKNYFHAGEGYRGVAECYDRFGETANMERFYRKAIDSYMKFIELMEKKKELNPTELKQLSDTYRYVGECYERINNLKQSEKYFQTAIESYNRTKENITKFDDKIFLENQILAIKGLLSKVKAKEAIDQGNYHKASELLNISENDLNKAIKNGGWTAEYEEYLDKNLREIGSLRRDIQIKPTLLLKMKYPSTVIQNNEFNVKITITNNWNGIIKDLGFLSKVPKEFDITITPSKIPVLKPGESKDISVGLIPREAGRFEFKVIDISYKDERGNSFVRGSEHLLLDVLKERKRKEKKREEKIEKPRIELITDTDISAFMNRSVTLNVTIINKGSVLVRDIDFLVHLPEGFKVESAPSHISELKPEESISKSVVIKPSNTGEYTLSPVEVYYKDKAGNKYVKKSDVINIKVMKKIAEKREQEIKIEELMREKDKIERMISKARSKYHKREIDEIAYRNLVEDYERELIAIEVEIERLVDDLKEQGVKIDPVINKKGNRKNNENKSRGIIVNVKYPENVNLNKSFSMDVIIENRTGKNIYNVRVLENTGSEFEIKKPFKHIKILKNGESSILSAEFIPKIAGSLGLKLFKISYKDESGRERIVDTERVFINIY